MSFAGLTLVLITYLLLISFIGFWAEKRLKPSHVQLQSWIYVFAFTVFCTSWTLFGSVGRAAVDGIGYLGIYLGATAGLWMAGPLVQKLIRLKNKFHITSIPDLLGARYSKSRSVALVSTLLLVNVLVPYIGLQLKSLTSTFQILTHTDAGHSLFDSGFFDFILICAISLITILFGLKKLDPTERHHGLMASIAFEGVVKALVIFIGGISIFVFSDFPVIELVFEGMESLKSPMPSYSTWIVSILLSMGAIIFLPRQFHILVVENSSIRDFKKIQTFMPMYMILLNVFVLPLALLALGLGVEKGQIDFAMLSLPMVSHREWVSVLVFLGGVSASVGMIVIALTASSNMVSNNMTVPVFNLIGHLNFLNRKILQQRWLIAFAVLFFAFLFQKLSGDAALVSLGMISFVGIFQLVPATVLGLYIPFLSSVGAIAGLVSGGLIWFFTLFLPNLIRAGVFETQLLEKGLFGLSWLHPEKLFGVTGLEPIPHATLWTLIFNVSFLFLFSQLFPNSTKEQKEAIDFISLMDKGELGRLQNSRLVVNFTEKVSQVEDLFYRFMPMVKSKELTQECLAECLLLIDSTPSVGEVAAFLNVVERNLAGIIGSPEAHRLISASGILNDEERERLSQEYAEIISELRISPQELRQKIDFYTEREVLLRKHVDELEDLVQARGSELATKTRSSFMSKMLSQVAHEVNNPLSVIRAAAERLDRLIEMDQLKADGARPLAEKIVRMTERIASVIATMIRINSSANQVKEVPSEVSIAEVFQSIRSITEDHCGEAGVVLEIDDVDASLRIKGHFQDVSLAVLNLVTNSIEAVSQLEVRWIKLKVEVLKEVIKIKVIDSGIGIPEFIVEKMMNPFFTTKQVGKGMGMGLSIAQKVIEDHGGKLYYDQLNPNTCFIIELSKTN